VLITYAPSSLFHLLVAKENPALAKLCQILTQLHIQRINFDGENRTSRTGERKKSATSERGGAREAHRLSIFASFVYICMTSCAT
jgi:hypothetical protein